MKRIYPNCDILFNVLTNHVPFRPNVLEELTLKFYTTNENQFVEKSQKDISEDGVLVLESNELSYLSEGVLRYDYKTDGVYKNDILTDYYICSKTTWGDIGGTLENQKDLINYINTQIDKAFQQVTEAVQQIKEYNKK